MLVALRSQLVGELKSGKVKNIEKDWFKILSIGLIGHPIGDRCYQAMVGTDKPRSRVLGACSRNSLGKGMRRDSVLVSCEAIR